jgi:23S rRNA (adenine2503-C2)-methyltransferase
VSETTPRVSLSELFFDQEQLLERVESFGGRPFHAKILREQVLGAGVLDYEAMTALPSGLRTAMAEAHPIFSGRQVDCHVAEDGTTKVLIGFPAKDADAEAAKLDMVEVVHIPSHRKAPGAGATLCVSTQVGCPVACPFCASGKLGLRRNLEAHEILEQYLAGRDIGKLSRSVVMGIGEPLLNFKNTASALRVVHDEIGLGARKTTLSSVGFPDRLRAAALEKPPFQLAISLHTPFDSQRDELVPAMKGVPIEDVLEAGDNWFEVTGREVTYEYVLLGGLNDTETHAHSLGQRLAGRRCMVNLIPYNPVPGSEFKRPSSEAVEEFRGQLDEMGLVVTVRWSRGLDQDAACGQLRLRTVQDQV